MAASSSPAKRKDESTIEEDAALFSFVREASVILPSGDRVRRQVSLTIYDEDPYQETDRTALLGSRGGAGTVGSSYSSIASIIVDRDIQPLDSKTSKVDKFKNWIQSEGLKRYYQPIRMT